MSRGTRYHFYGLYVRSVDLLHATMAWPYLRRTFLAIDLVRRRRNLGKLSVAGRPRLVDVPDEVWEMIKLELVALQVEDAGKELSRQVRCTDCQRKGLVPVDCRELLRGCDVCIEEFVSGANLRDRLLDRSEVRPFPS
jgi:hypothetical protein